MQSAFSANCPEYRAASQASVPYSRQSVHFKAPDKELGDILAFLSIRRDLKELIKRRWHMGLSYESDRCGSLNHTLSATDEHCHEFGRSGRESTKAPFCMK
jgi:hypothetical protein